MNTNLTDDQLRQMLKTAKALDEKKANSVLFDFEPYDKQWDYINCKSKSKALIAGNQCLAGDTIIVDPVDGTSRRLDTITDRFRVNAISCDGRVVTVYATAPTVKPGQLYDATFSSGKKIGITLDHSILGPSGWTEIGQKPRFSLYLPRSTSGIYQPVPQPDARHCSDTTEDSQFGYQTYPHSDGEPLRLDLTSGQDVRPSQADALAHKLERFRSLFDGPLGVQAGKRDGIHLDQLLLRLSSRDDFHPVEDHAFASDDQTCGELRLHALDLDQAVLLFGCMTDRYRKVASILEDACQVFLASPESLGDQGGYHSEYKERQSREMGFLTLLTLHTLSEVQIQEVPECALSLLDTLLTRILCAYQGSCGTSFVSIVQIDSPRNGLLYEFEVERYGNFILDGIVLHNCGKSSVMRFEESCHLTGNYPTNWTGIRYDRPVDTWIIGETATRVRDTLQVGMFGELGRIGTGMIPKDCIGQIVNKAGVPGAIDKAFVKHSSGGWSSVQYFSYEMGREKFQGSTIDRCCFDEEPPAEILNECRIRLIVKDGIETFTFTPLNGATKVTDTLLESKDTSKFSIWMDHAPWMTPEKIERILANCEPWEYQARRYGIIVTGSTAIFKYKPEDYTCDSFEIPNHWPRMGGLDIGGNHPTGAVALAWDRDSGCIYIYQEAKITGDKANAPDVARALKPWGIQFATSHDAFNKSFQTGKTVSDVFKDEGLRVFSAGRDPWARIEKVKSLMASGSFWIFKDKCPNLVKEFAAYRTKDDMKTIFKHDEDLVDAATHAVQFYEKAEVQGYVKPVPKVIIPEWKAFDTRLGV